jgi:hypothetical protein
MGTFVTPRRAHRGICSGVDYWSQVTSNRRQNGRANSVESTSDRKDGMDSNPVYEMTGRPLRLAVIGGAPGSFIGGMHRASATMDGRFEIVASVLSSDPEGPGDLLGDSDRRRG